jgi:hypothetical protein
MSNAKYDELYAKYPKIFRDSETGKRTISWGFEINEGWFTLLDVLCSNIQYYIDWKKSSRGDALFRNAMFAEAKADNWGKFDEYHKNWNLTEDELAKERKRAQTSEPGFVPEEVSQVVATQVKEKFGELCFYHIGGDDYTDGMVQIVEALSGRTCELCGQPGRLTGNSWIAARCESCLKKDKDNE